MERPRRMVGWLETNATVLCIRQWRSHDDDLAADLPAAAPLTVVSVPLDGTPATGRLRMH